MRSEYAARARRICCGHAMFPLPIRGVRYTLSNIKRATTMGCFAKESKIMFKMLLSVYRTPRTSNGNVARPRRLRRARAAYSLLLRSALKTLAIRQYDKALSLYFSVINVFSCQLSNKVLYY